MKFKGENSIFQSTHIEILDREIVREKLDSEKLKFKVK